MTRNEEVERLIQVWLDDVQSNPFPVVLVIIAVLILIYFLPTCIAMSRKHHNSMAIFVLNLTLGWTFFGWAAALVWAHTNLPKDTAKPDAPSLKPAKSQTKSIPLMNERTVITATPVALVDIRQEEAVSSSPCRTTPDLRAQIHVSYANGEPDIQVSVIDGKMFRVRLPHDPDCQRMMDAISSYLQHPTETSAHVKTVPESSSENAIEACSTENPRHTSKTTEGISREHWRRDIHNEFISQLLGGVMSIGVPCYIYVTQRNREPKDAILFLTGPLLPSAGIGLCFVVAAAISLIQGGDALALIWCVSFLWWGSLLACAFLPGWILVDGTSLVYCDRPCCFFWPRELRFGRSKESKIVVSRAEDSAKSHIIVTPENGWPVRIEVHPWRAQQVAEALSFELSRGVLVPEVVEVTS